MGSNPCPVLRLMSYSVIEVNNAHRQITNNKITCTVIALTETSRTSYLRSSRSAAASEISALHVNLNFYRPVDLILYSVDLKIYSSADTY